MIVACIDIGSNTTRLLVADVAAASLCEIHQERVFTRIGARIEPEGTIPASTIAEVAEVVCRQLDAARAHGAQAVRVVATAAVRAAGNGTDLADAVAARGGERVEILAEFEEARLAFVGAARTLGREPRGEIVVIDLGGGSTELAVGRPPDRMAWCASLPVGSGALAERYLQGDPPAPGELAAARREARAALEALTLPPAAEAIAVGGSATSLRRLVGDRLQAGSFARALARLTAAPSAALAAETGLDPLRVRLLPAGLVVLEAISEQLGLPLEVGRGGLREGVVLEAAARAGTSGA